MRKLTAGSGYDYLTRQVAAMDSTEKGHTTLTSYYSEKGETPGRWVGSGLTGLDMTAESPVDEKQMLSLFGIGDHPNAEARLAALPHGSTRAEIRAAVRLGAPFKIYRDATRFQEQVTERCAIWAAEHGLAAGDEVPVDVRAEIRNQLATASFQARVGRAPIGVELSSEVARLSRNPNTACAGFDVTFSPVKSVSTLWAVAPRPVSAAIEECHNAAVAEALAYIERQVLFSRRGANGVRQVEVTGLVGTAFTHRDSRAGDPDLHTHVAIANKVQTLDGAWLAIDGRPLYAGLTSVSEVYNSSLEAHLVQRLGVRFEEEPHRDPSKRGIREIAGVPAVLREAWSTRRALIVAREADLAVKFQSDHGRPPTPVEALKLAQQATLETREAKHEPRTIDEQRTTWQTQAETVLGPHGITRMLRAVQAAGRVRRSDVGPEWVVRTADQIVDTMGLHRASWTMWHLHAEASRRAREHATTPDQMAALTEQLVDAATQRCVPVDTWTDPIQEPPELRRTTGESMYETVGTRRYTSTTVLDAEQQIMNAAALTDGRRVTEEDVSLALLGSTANGVELNAGQVQLVRQLATSGRRVQLALAAAGTGKTTALAVLADAWREGGGNVVGLAPSAVAARQLADQTGHATTMAKLAWDLTHQPNDADRLVGPGSLVIVDEAGMADTPTLAHIIGYTLSRGGSVRLIGDDQQLAAIGAGGILRDITNSYGAVQLNQIMRFRDPAEAAASLALRDGRPEALGYYLDHDRLHAGTDETILTGALHAWITDTKAGLDSLMLAGTRDQVTTLNRWARQHRLHNNPAAMEGPAVALVDGNQASAGDVIITRLNDRRLPISATDWVKNGDRWTITTVTPTGAISAVHTTSGLHVTLPADYVRDNVELGYAVTVHAAQGITVDATHTILTGQETRQQAYVALTRGRHANHAYIQVVGDTTESAAIDPRTLRPVTAIDVLDTILARDGAARSVTTDTAQSTDPHTRLGVAVARYTDALTVAIEHTNPDAVHALDEGADLVVSELTACPAWPTLRAHLLHTATSIDVSPLDLLRHITEARELDTAADPAAVLTWRLPQTTTSGPLPWLPAIPASIADNQTWCPYLAARANQVRVFADEVRAAVGDGAVPGWALPGQALTPQLIGDVEVWRAAWQVDPADRRPTGPTQLGALPHAWQQQLLDRLRPVEPVTVWLGLLETIRDDIPSDPYAPILAHRLAALHRAGVPITEHLADAATNAPLPSEQPAAALWWRLTRHLTGEASSDADLQPLTLAGHVDPQVAAELEASPWWPALAAEIHRGLTTGLLIGQLVTEVPDLSGFDDRCQAILWHAHQLNEADTREDVEEPPHPDELPPDDIHLMDWNDHTAALEAAARLRDRTDPDFTSLELDQAFAAADRWDDEPHTPERLAQITEATTRFYEQHLAGSWTRTYLAERLGQDLAGDPRFRIGHAPAGWTHLTTALHRQGFTDQEMIAAGVASMTRRGALIDRFRDRAILPIVHNQTVVGFVGRRHPDADDQHGPKYLNSPTTALFAKRDILYGHHLLPGNPDAVPVIVEGPLDAIAITLAGRNRYVGVAPLGTALTPEQTLLLRGWPTALIGTDNDPAGNTAAEHAYWLLAQHRHDPGRVHLPDGNDPASHLHDHGESGLRELLDSAPPQADHMIQERAASLTADTGLEIAEIIAARPSQHWNNPALTSDQQPHLLERIKAWTLDPRRAAEQAREQTRTARRRQEQQSIDRPGHLNALLNQNHRRRYPETLQPRQTRPTWGPPR